MDRMKWYLVGVVLSSFFLGWVAGTWNTKREARAIFTKAIEDSGLRVKRIDD